VAVRSQNAAVRQKIRSDARVIFDAEIPAIFDLQLGAKTQPRHEVGVVQVGPEGTGTGRGGREACSVPISSAGVALKTTLFDAVVVSSNSSDPCS
jgi:hypothetical protein